MSLFPKRGVLFAHYLVVAVYCTGVWPCELCSGLSYHHVTLNIVGDEQKV